METASYGSTPDNNMIFMVISIISWALLIVTGWMSFGVPKVSTFCTYGKDKEGICKIIITWLSIHYNKDSFEINTMPVTINYIVFFMMVSIILLLLVASFVVFINGIITKNENILNGMLGNYSKFHFIPLLCVSSLFIIGESLDKFLEIKGIHCFFNLFFTIIGLGSLVFITMQTNIESPNYASWIIKHGGYSSLIAWLSYNLFYIIFYYHILLTDKDLEKWFKGCEIAFSIIIGILNLGLGLFLKTVMLPFINLLIYIGMTCRFFKLEKLYRKALYGSETGGIIDIVMIVLSILELVFIILQMQKKS